MLSSCFSFIFFPSWREENSGLLYNLIISKKYDGPSVLDNRLRLGVGRGLSCKISNFAVSYREIAIA